MFLMTSLLRKRLFIGYFITGFIVISMVTAMINERCRLKELKNLIIQINEAYVYNVIDLKSIKWNNTKSSLEKSDRFISSDKFLQ